ncbi:MAG: MATE family efflux transporter, partial [Oscillospiraceae bacterium]
MSKKRIDFAADGTRKSILSLALPMMVAQLLSLMYNITDRIYIGNLPLNGEFALGGVGICFPIITIVNGFANLFGLGGAPLFSIASGKNDAGEAKKIMSNSFWMLVITGFALTALLLAFHEPILYLFGASENTFSYASSYMT